MQSHKTRIVKINCNKEVGKELSHEKLWRQLTYKIPGYLKILFSEFEVLSRLPHSLWALQHDKQTNKQTTTYSLQNPFVHVCNVPISIPLHKSWMCSFPPPAQLPWRRAPSSPAEYWHHGIRWRGPSGPRWLWLPPGTPTPTAYLSAIDSSGFNSLMVDTDKDWGR